MTPDQRNIQTLTDEVMHNPTTSMRIVWSLYGPGETTFLQRLAQARNHERVLLTTYQQTVARDTMRNFGKFVF